MEENIKRFYDDVYGGSGEYSESGVDGAIGGFFMWCRHCAGTDVRCFNWKWIGRVQFVSFDKALRRLDRMYEGKKMGHDAYMEAKGRIMAAKLEHMKDMEEKREKVIREARELYGDGYDYRKLCIFEKFVKKEDRDEDE